MCLVILEMPNLRLSAAATMYHAVQVWVQLYENIAQNGQISSSRREEQVANRVVFILVNKSIGEAAAADKRYIVGHFGIVAFGEAVRVVVRECVVSRRGQAVAADAAIVRRFVARLTRCG